MFHVCGIEHLESMIELLIEEPQEMYNAAFKHMDETGIRLFFCQRDLEHSRGGVERKQD